ncbi:hypothetical protein [Cryobacterium sp. PH31-L1]|uniref:hypothetical protein n=1 Tax=Cryobacterium sp. PH31-L1 TaxID=3046199 RepID=UPI0024BBA6A8|nr:hypothetical protein [Cryobacterium sp. PH31-L1]MDJ0379004.1 hypothetical protein [Cryobacterium sp. PH31-L1]
MTTKLTTMDVSVLGPTFNAAPNVRELVLEIGDAGAPLLVGALGSAVISAIGLGALAILIFGVADLGATARRTRPSDDSELDNTAIRGRCQFC